MIDFFHKGAEMTKKVVGVAKLKGAPDVEPRPVRKLCIGTFRNGKDKAADILLEVADTPEARRRGLMGRKEIPPVLGMLFEGLSGGGYFWMKDCLVPIDVAFMDKYGAVVKTYSMPVDKEGEKHYEYGDDVTSAVEVAEGMLKKWGVKAGSTLKVRQLKGREDG